MKMIAISRLRRKRGSRECTCFLLVGGLPIILPPDSYTLNAAYATVGDSRVIQQVQLTKQKKLTFLRDDVISIIRDAEKMASGMEDNCRYVCYNNFLHKDGKSALIKTKSVPKGNERLILILRIGDNGEFAISASRLNIDSLIERWSLVHTLDLAYDIRKEINKKLIESIFT